MMLFELTLHGVEDRKWVKAPNRHTLDDWIKMNRLHDLVREIRVMEKYTFKYTMADGVDVIVTTPSNFQVTSDLATWREEVVFDVEDKFDEAMNNKVWSMPTPPTVDHSPKPAMPSFLIGTLLFIAISLLIALVVFTLS